jgi:hypothetical protein
MERARDTERHGIRCGLRTWIDAGPHVKQAQAYGAGVRILAPSGRSGANLSISFHSLHERTNVSGVYYPKGNICDPQLIIVVRRTSS